MKQLLIILLILVFLTVCGCSLENNKNESQVSDTSAIVTSGEDKNNTSQDTTTASTDSTSTERSEIDTGTPPVNSKDTTSNTEKAAENNNSESTTSGSGSKTTSEPKMPTASTESISTPSESTPSDSAETVPPKATSLDVDEIAEMMLEYLNEYRRQEGTHALTSLPGLTEYAKYRSRQLVTNFAHDTFDERAAATALQYGKYVDPSIHGLTDEPYYTANAREAIAKTDYGGTIDQVAAYLSRLVKNSASHWEYVGGARYNYIGIGITYDKGKWYCDIAMSSVNTDN